MTQARGVAGERGAAARPAILVTRPAPQGEATAAALDAQGWAPILCPLTRFRALETAPDWDAARGVALTSANALRAAAPPDRALGLPVWCVGEATAAAARAAGFRDVRVGGGDAAALARLILADGAAGPLLHPRGAHGTEGFAQALRDGGVPVLEAEVYRMEPVRGLPEAAAAALGGDAPVAVALYSPRGAALFAGLAAGARAPLHVVAISDAAAAALGPLRRARVVVAARPGGAEMLEAARGALSRIGGVGGARGA